MKTIAKIGLIIILLGTAAPVLGQETVGLLPTNPFYFLKEWGRSFRKAITAAPSKKVELELKVFDEKIAELKKLAEILPENTNGLMRAVNNYTYNLNRLKDQFDLIKETSVNPVTDRLLNELAKRGLRHHSLFDELINRFDSKEELKAGLAAAKERLLEVLAAILQRLDTSVKIQPRLMDAIAALEDEPKDLIGAEWVDDLSGKLAGDLTDKLLQIKENLLLKISGRLEAKGLPADFENLSGDRLRRLEILDELRERVVNPDLKSGLNILRQRLLDKAEKELGIGLKQAEDAIKSAQEFIAELEFKISEREGDVPNAVRQLLERTKFNASQAERLLSEGNYGGAFGQATAASAAARNALIQLLQISEENVQPVDDLRTKYDQLLKQANEKFSRGSNQRLFDLLAEAEKRIIELSKLILDKSANGKIAAAIRAVKLILATIEELAK